MFNRVRLCPLIFRGINGGILILLFNLCPQMPLTDIVCKNTKPSDKSRKLADGNGLYLEVSPNGSKYWRLKYRFVGKEKRLALGVYKTIGAVASTKDLRYVIKKVVRNAQGKNKTFAF